MILHRLFFRLTLKQSACDRFLAQVSDGQVTQQEKQADGRQIKGISCHKDATYLSSSGIPNFVKHDQIPQ